MARRLASLTLIAIFVAVLGVGAHAVTSGATQAAGPVSNPHAHVMVIVEENHSYASIIGSPEAPYINSLAKQYTLATNSYSLWHDSMGNYLGLLSGSTQGVPYGTDAKPGCYPCSAPTLVDELSAQGTSWRAYMESMPEACDTSLADSGEYVARHDPFMYFAGVTSRPAECDSVVPFSSSRFADDLNSAAAPDFVWVTPDLLDDMHSASVSQGDTWLQSTMSTVLSSGWYRDGGVVIITWDESTDSDRAALNASVGGGHIATLVVSNASHGEYTAALNHYGTLRGIEETYGVGLLGGSADAANGDLRAAFAGVTSVTPTPDPSGSPTPSSNPTSSASPSASPTATPSPTFPTGGGQGERDPLFQPYTSNSIWNQPIGSGAEYAAADIQPPSITPMTADVTTVLMDAGAPMTPILQGPAGQDGDRCATGGSTLETVPLPASFTLGNNGANEGFAVLSSNGTTLVEGGRFARCAAGGPATASSVRVEGSIYDDGLTGATGGSGMSTLGGLLRVGDLAPGSLTTHALRLDLDGETDLFHGTAQTCYRWPATHCDGYGPQRYGGSNPELVMGSLLAIPRTVNLSDLGLQTAAAQQLAWTLQYYGAYVVNDTARPVASLGVEQGDQNFLAAFQQEWGFAFATNGANNTPWAHDMYTILAALRVVSNNGPYSVGGGGLPLRPLAPALMPVSALPRND